MMYWKLKHIMLAAILMACSLAYGAFTANDAGTSTGTFLKMGSSARAAAMGEAYSCLCEDASAVYYNPAGLNYSGDFGVSLMHAVWVEDISYEWAGLSLGLGSIGKFGIGLQYVSYGSLPGADSTGLDTAAFSPSDIAVSLSLASKIAGFDLGVTGKYISMTIKQSVSTFAFDAGLIKKMNLFGADTVISITGRNFGLPVSFGAVSENLPGSLNLGLAFLASDFVVSGEACFPQDNQLFYMAGAEYSIIAANYLIFKLRAGYNTRTAQTGELGGITTGLGIASGGCSLDYAYIPLGELGYTHRISFSMMFGKNK